MQFRNLLVLRRLFATTKTVSKSAKPLSKASSPNSSAASSPTVDISKMPQPHPVLTPLSRRIIDQAGIQLQPSFEACNSNAAYQVKLEGELQKRLPRNLAQVTEHFGANVFVYRKDLIDRIQADLQSSKDQIILDGPNGSGKSVILMNIYAGLAQMYREDRDKILIYAPNAYKWTLGYFAYYPDGPSAFKQPELAYDIMQLMQLCNGPEKMPQGFAEELQAVKSDLYNRAVPLYEKTMQNFCDTGKQVIFLLDGVNGLIDSECETGYLDPNIKEDSAAAHTTPNNLPLKSFPLCNQFFNKSRANTKVIGALTLSHTLLPQVKVESLDPKRSVIKVPNYSREELSQVLALYSQLGHCNTNKSDQFIQFKAFVSGSNGRKLFKSCEHDAVYNSSFK